MDLAFLYAFRAFMLGIRFINFADLCRDIVVTYRNKVLKLQFFSVAGCQKINSNRPNHILIYRLHGWVGGWYRRAVTEKHALDTQNFIYHAKWIFWRQRHELVSWWRKKSQLKISGNADNWINLIVFCVPFQ